MTEEDVKLDRDAAFLYRNPRPGTLQLIFKCTVKTMKDFMYQEVKWKMALSNNKL